MTPRGTMVLVATLCLARQGEARAQGRNDPWQREVRSALDSAAGRVAGAVVLRDGTRLGVLSEGERAALTVLLHEGASYVVLAVCDGDCGRLALQVTDPRRYELDSDRSATRQPALRVTASVGGPHRIEAVMTQCRINPCRYGVVVLRVPGAPAPRRTTGTGLISRDGRPHRTPRVLAGPAPDL